MIKKTTITIVIAVIICITTIGVYILGYFEKPEFLMYDSSVKLIRSGKKPPKNIKVILIDEASLQALEGVAGRWPWPRAIWADLLDFLSLGGAKAVLFDILFTEKTGQHDESNDRILAEATQASQNVYHSMVIKWDAPDDNRNLHAHEGLPMPDDFIRRFSLKNVSGFFGKKSGRKNNDYSLPIDPLPEVSKGIAVVEFSKDNDGVLRRTKPLREYQGRYFPVLGLAPFLNENTPIAIRDEGLMINDRILPLDGEGNYLINMVDIDKVDPYPYSIGGVFASLQKIRQGEVEGLEIRPEEFKDAIVFIGASAVGTQDLKTTPLASSTPGVALHVSLASNYLQNDFLKPPDRRITILSILLGSFLASGAIFSLNRFLVRVIFPVVMLVAYVGYSLCAFRTNLVLEVVPFIFATLSSSFLSFGYLTFTESAEKRRVSQLFTQYVSKDVLDEVLHNYKDYFIRSSTGSKVEITVLFSDIRGFTTMSETARPEKIVEMLNVHFARMADIILRHGGTVDKYIGDAIMAFWGAPIATKDHAEKAVTAAKEMLDALHEVNRTLKERGFEMDIKIGIGINTGVATIGNIGSEKKLSYTVVGDTVNLASRLESITKEYNSPLVFSEYTYEQVKNTIDCELLGNVKIKGREQPVTIYTLV